MMVFTSATSASRIIGALRRSASKLLPTLLLVSNAFMAWKSLCVLTNSSSPILVVSSESMAPAFHRGDIIVIWNREPFIRVGDIPVVWLPGRNLPMVHRAIKIRYELDYEGKDAKKRQKILTKGDNNDVDDTAIYGDGRRFIDRDEVLGVVWAYMPMLGWPTLAVYEVIW